MYYTNKNSKLIPHLTNQFHDEDYYEYFSKQEEELSLILYNYLNAKFPNQVDCYYFKRWRELDYNCPFYKSAMEAQFDGVDCLIKLDSHLLKIDLKCNSDSIWERYILNSPNPTISIDLGDSKGNHSPLRHENLFCFWGNVKYKSGYLFKFDNVLNIPCYERKTKEGHTLRIIRVNEIPKCRLINI